MAYYLGYYAQMKERIQAELDACYASDWSAVDRLAARWGVDVFVADLERYRRPIDVERTYYEPFRTTIQETVRRGEASGFVLEAPPPDRVLFRAGGYVVVKVKSPE
jgi:hypothetical protein